MSRDQTVDYQLILNTILMNLGEPVDLICEYLSYFAAKPCCFVDLRPMLGLLNEHQIRSLFDKRIQEITLLPYICGCDRSAITYAANVCMFGFYYNLNVVSE